MQVEFVVDLPDSSMTEDEALVKAKSGLELIFGTGSVSTGSADGLIADSKKERASAAKTDDQKRINDFAELVDQEVSQMADDVLPQHMRYYSKNDQKRFKTEIAIENLSKAGKLEF